MARNILLKLTGDNDDAKLVVDETIDDIKKLKAEAEATIVSIRVDNEEANRQLDEVRAKIESTPREETIRIRIQAETASLDKAEAQLAALKAQSAEAGVGGEIPNSTAIRMGQLASRIEGSQSRIQGLASDLEKLGSSGGNGVSRVDRAVKSLTGSLTGARTGLVSFVADALGKVPLIGGMFEKVAKSAGKLVTSLLPQAASGFTGLVSAAAGLAGVGTILGIIVAALAALVSSLGMALIGVAALAVGFLVALGPIAVLLGIVATKIKDIVSGQMTLASATANLKSALDSQKQAVTALQQAEVNEGNQRIQALNAQINAVNALKDAENQLNDAKLGALSAAQAVQQARLTLASFDLELRGLGTSPSNLAGATQSVQVGGNLGQTQVGSNKLAFQQMLLQYKEDILGVKTALQQQKDATQQVTDAQAQQSQAQQLVNQYQQLGLKAFPGYLSATQAQTTATQNLKRAEDQVASAELARVQAIRHGAAEASAFETAWKDLKKTLGTVFGPAEKAVFGGIEQALVIMAKGLKPLEPAFLTLGKAIGGAFVWWAKMMVKPANMHILESVIRGAAGLTEKMSHYLGAVFRILGQISSAAMPMLLKLIGHRPGELSTISHQHNAVKDFIVKCIAATKKWWDELKSVFGFAVVLVKTFQPLLTIFEKLALAAEAVGKALGIGAGGGLLGGGLLAAVLLKGGGKGLIGGLGSLLTGGGAVGGGLAVGASVLAAGAAGYGIGTVLNDKLGISKGIDSLLGGTVGGPTSAMNAANASSKAEAIRSIEEVLRTGHWRGSASGKLVSASAQESLIRSLAQLGVDWHRLAARLPAPSSHVATASPAAHARAMSVNVHLNQGDTIADDQHFVSVLEKRIAATGSGFGGRG